MFPGITIPIKESKSLSICPDSDWFQNTLGDCIKFYDVSSLRSEAVTTCNSISLNGNSARLLRLIDVNRAEVIWNDIADGRFPGLNMSADSYSLRGHGVPSPNWYDARFWIDAVKTSNNPGPDVIPPDGVIWEADSCPANVAGVFLKPGLNFKIDFPDHPYVTANALPDQAGMYMLGQIMDRAAKFFCIIEGTVTTTTAPTTTTITTAGIISQILR